MGKEQKRNVSYWQNIKTLEIRGPYIFYYFLNIKKAQQYEIL